MTAAEFYGQLQNNYDMAIPQSEMNHYYDMLAEEQGREPYTLVLAKKRISSALQYAQNSLKNAEQWREAGNHEMADMLTDSANKMMVEINKAIEEL